MQYFDGDLGHEKDMLSQVHVSEHTSP